MADAVIKRNFTPVPDRSSNSFLGFPGWYLASHYVGIKSGSWYQVSCDANLNVRFTMSVNFYAYLSVSINHHYYHPIWASPKYFTLTRSTKADEVIGLPSHAKQLAVGDVNYRGSASFATCNWNVKCTNIYIGKLTDFGWNEEDQGSQTGYFYIAGVATDYDITDNITVKATKIPIPGMKTWINYFPGEQCVTGKDFGSGISWNKPGYFVRQMNGGKWTNITNWNVDDNGKDKISYGWYYSGGGWNSKLPMIGEQ